MTLTPETLRGMARLFPSRRAMPRTSMGLDAHADQWEQDLARIEALETRVIELQLAWRSGEKPDDHPELLSAVREEKRG